MDILKNKISLKNQEEILNVCVKRNLPLADALIQKGLTYDSLRYRDYFDFMPKEGRCEILEEKNKMPSTIPAISFFSGAGGLNIGFEYAGFENLASIEFNKILPSKIVNAGGTK
jgi:DNA (cytosine-5)-methyltransferase 1